MKHIYMTEQRRGLLAFLREDPGKHYTIGEIVAGLSERSDAPGKSTIYRLMKELVSEGLVRRFSNGTGREFLYQIIDCESCGSHLHLKCLSCGKLIHMDNDISDLFQDRILKLNDFELDERRTLLFGTCSDCKYAAAGKKTN